MILALLTVALAQDVDLKAWEAEPLLLHNVPRPLPSDDPSIHGVVDLEDLVIVRPQGTELRYGFNYGGFTRAVEASVSDRTGYDFVCIVHSDQLPTQFSGAAAFHLSYNNTKVWGTGKYRVKTPYMDIKAALWMSYPSYWDSWGTEASIWVFGQEMGHYWLAFADFDQGDGDDQGLLGRGDSHWSWFMNTSNSPMEGNRWIDNGDGSFTTDIGERGTFAPIDLYLMGLIEAEDVGPMFYIEPSDSLERANTSAPEFLWTGQDMTIMGTRMDVTVDDVISAEGQRLPTVADSPSQFSILPVLVVGPNEMITDALLERVHDRFAEWENGWVELTDGLSTVSFEIAEPRVLPEFKSTELVPRGAW